MWEGLAEASEGGGTLMFCVSGSDGVVFSSRSRPIQRWRTLFALEEPDRDGDVQPPSPESAGPVAPPPLSLRSGVQRLSLRLVLRLHIDTVDPL